MLKVETTVELSQREQMFVMAIAYGLAETRAAKAAGYAASSAKLLLGKPHICAALKTIHENTRKVAERIEKREAKQHGEG